MRCSVGRVLPCKDEDQRLHLQQPYKKLEILMRAYSLGAGGKSRRCPGLMGHLFVELERSSFCERPCLRTIRGNAVEEDNNIHLDLWPPHLGSHVLTCGHAHSYLSPTPRVTLVHFPGSQQSYLEGVVTRGTPWVLL